MLIGLCKQLLVALHAGSQSDDVPGHHVGEQQEEGKPPLDEGDVGQDGPVAPVPAFELQVEGEEQW